jgi:hypothetical protein
MRFYDVPVNRSVPTEANRGLTSYSVRSDFIGIIRRCILHITRYYLFVTCVLPPKQPNCILSGQQATNLYLVQVHTSKVT